MLGRSFSALQLAVGIALVGSLLAIFIPSFLRNLHASRLTEAVRGVNAIATGAMIYAEGKLPAEAFPPSAPLTPAEVPRGERVEDPPGTWDHLTWAALGFRMDHAHSFCFAFDSNLGPARSTFVARAHGDLDGDGERSTFELHGEALPGGAHILPGLFVDREVE
jgi:type II secretory pathway pseudopilin PulG